MIKNIIFDLGNVLISFRPAEYLEKKKYPDETKKIILSDIFGSDEWLLLDNGDISAEEAINSISGKSSLKKAEIKQIFDRRTEIFYPIDNNIKVLPVLKERGFKLYFISNFPGDIFDEVKNSYPFFDYFEGGIISAEVNISKPDPGIFTVFLERYGLRAEECLYLDDTENNVSAAISAGLNGLATFGSRNLLCEVDVLLDRCLA